MNTLYSFLAGMIICSLLNINSTLKRSVNELKELREPNKHIILLWQHEACESSLYPLTEHVLVNESSDDNSDSIEVNPLHNVTASDSEGGIEVCIEICPDLGKMIGYDSYTGHFQKRTLLKLKANGFLSESTCYIAGLRWQCCSLNQRGFEWLKQHGVQSHD